MKESITCQKCHTDYYIEWFEDIEDEYGECLVPDFCPFCGSADVEVEDDIDTE
jgi:Zn finger protein HypA/HybF involved in hydrogenase expression